MGSYTPADVDNVISVVQCTRQQAEDALKSKGDVAAAIDHLLNAMTASNQPVEANQDDEIQKAIAASMQTAPQGTGTIPIFNK